MPRKIEISHRTIVFTVFFLLATAFLFFIKDILLQLFLAVLIMVTLNPTVTKLSKFRIPRAASVLIVYLLFIGLVVFSLGSLIPPIIEQTTSFGGALPKYLENIGIPAVFREQVTKEFLGVLGAIPAQIVRVAVSIFSNIFDVLTVLIFAFYLLLARNKLDQELAGLVGEKYEAKVGKTIDELEKRLGGWARGQLTLMFLVGSLTYVGLLLLGIPFALPLGVLAGLLEIVPYIGPVIAAIPAVLIGFGISSFVGLATIALAFLIQQLENYVFVPKVMEKSVGLPPVVILLALAVGFKLVGIIGVLLSIPVVITGRVLLREFLLKK